MHQCIQVNQKRKFSCKICCSAQSVKAVLGSASSGRELRATVQALNMSLQDEDRALEESKRQQAARAEAPTSPAAAPSDAAEAPASALARWGRYCPEGEQPASMSRGSFGSAGPAGIAATSESDARFTTMVDDPQSLAVGGGRGKGKGKGKGRGRKGKGFGRFAGAAQDPACADEEEGDGEGSVPPSSGGRGYGRFARASWQTEFREDIASLPTKRARLPIPEDGRQDGWGGAGAALPIAGLRAQASPPPPAVAAVSGWAASSAVAATSPACSPSGGWATPRVVASPARISSGLVPSLAPPFGADGGSGDFSSGGGGGGGGGAVAGAAGKWVRFADGAVRGGSVGGAVGIVRLTTASSGISSDHAAGGGGASRWARFVG